MPNTEWKKNADKLKVENCVGEEENKRKRWRRKDTEKNTNTKSEKVSKLTKQDGQSEKLEEIIKSLW